MELVRVLETLRALAAGVDPVTGEALAAQGPFQHADVVRSLFVAVDAVRRRLDGERRKASLPNNSGRRWSKEEDADLKVHFTGGTAVAEIARTHERSTGAVVARLVLLGCVDLERLQAPGVRQ